MNTLNSNDFCSLITFTVFTGVSTSEFNTTSAWTNVPE